MDAKPEPKKKMLKAQTEDGPIQPGTPLYRLLEALARAIAEDLRRSDRPQPPE